jgi:hypothetical protein
VTGSPNACRVRPLAVVRLPHGPRERSIPSVTSATFVQQAQISHPVVIIEHLDAPPYFLV